MDAFSIRVLPSLLLHLFLCILCLMLLQIKCSQFCLLNCLLLVYRNITVCYSSAKLINQFQSLVCKFLRVSAYAITSPTKPVRLPLSLSDCDLCCSFLNELALPHTADHKLDADPLVLQVVGKKHSVFHCQVKM